MNKMLLIKYGRAWGDVFNAEGFTVMKRGCWENYCFQATYCISYPVTYYLSENLSFTFNTPSDFIHSFKFSSITDKEAYFLCEEFGIQSCNEYGFDSYFGIMPDVLTGNIEKQFEKFYDENDNFIGVEEGMKLIKEKERVEQSDKT